VDIAAHENSTLEGARLHVYFVVSVAISVDIYWTTPLTEGGVTSTMEIEFVGTPVLAFCNYSRAGLRSIDLWILQAKSTGICSRRPILNHKGAVDVLSVGAAQQVVELVRLRV